MIERPQKIMIAFMAPFVLIALSLFISGALATGLVYGWNYVDYNFTMYQYLWVLWKWALDNFAALSFFDTNNFTLMYLTIATVSPAVVLAVLLFLMRAPLMDFRPFEKAESIHGDARWANQHDIKKAGLRAKVGMLLGRDRQGYFVTGGYQHALLFAPTGSGKGVGFVIPNLLFWEHSVAVHDIKLENYEITSGYRQKMGQKVYLWNPASPDGISHCYNPLDWISPKPGQMVDDIQKISNLLLPEQEFWQNEARSLCVGVMLYLCCVPEKLASFGEVVRTLRSDDVVYNLAVVLDTIGKQIHPVAYMNIAAFLQKADKERSGVISTLNSSLELWANPLIDSTTAKSDFNIEMWKKEPTTVYIGLTPDNLERLQPLMKIFYQQATQLLCKHMPRDDEPFGVMFMMDEFPTLGEMEQFKNGIAYFRGYNVRLFLIIQDTQQLKGIYEEAGMNSFLSNATYRITFAANNVETAELISKLVGNKTVKQYSLNKPKFFDLNPASRSMHESETQRALLLPQEVIGLPKDQQIVLIESFPPIKSQKIFYFKDSFFTKRLLPPIPIPEQEPYDPNKARGYDPQEEQSVSDSTEEDNEFISDDEQEYLPSTEHYEEENPYEHQENYEEEYHSPEGEHHEDENENYDDTSYQEEHEEPANEEYNETDLEDHDIHHEWEDEEEEEDIHKPSS